MSNKSPIELRIGETGESFVRRNPTLPSVDRQPAGLNFYELNWSTKAMGQVILESGAGSVKIPNVINITGTEDGSLPDEGISEFHVNSTITNATMIGHDEARVRTFAYLNEISKNGWKVVIPRSMPRIRGKDMSDYQLNTGHITTLDLNYVPSLEEWMRYEDLTTWAFYANHVFLQVQITREHTLIDPSKPGAYLLSTNLESERQHFRSYVNGRDRARWSELLTSEVTKMAQQRAKMESEFRSKGVTIDETYIDPPLPDEVK